MIQHPEALWWLIPLGIIAISALSGALYYCIHGHPTERNE